MNRIARRPIVAVVVCAALLMVAGCNSLKARDQLNKGVESFKTGNYDQAISHFQQATKLDPKLPMARLYLATAYAHQVVPNLKTPDNMKNADLAIQMFESVLKEDPKNVNAVKGIASLYFNTEQLDKAKEYQKKVLALDPNDADAHYTIGVIDWTLAYKNAIPARQSVGLKDNGDPIKDKKVCAALAEKNGPLIEEGMQSLQKAVQIRPTDDNAMAYINLMYRRKADIECGDDAARKADLASANEWVQKAMEARKANQLEKEQQTPKGIELGK